MTLNEASDLYFQYLRVEKGVSNETIRNYEYDLKLFFDALHKETTKDLKSGDIQEFIRIQTQNMLSIPTILRRISSTKNFYLFLEKERIITFQIDSLEKPKASTSSIDIQTGNFLEPFGFSKESIWNVMIRSFSKKR